MKKLFMVIVAGMMTITNIQAQQIHQCTAEEWSRNRAEMKESVKANPNRAFNTMRNIAVSASASAGVKGYEGIIAAEYSFGKFGGNHVGVEGQFGTRLGVFATYRTYLYHVKAHNWLAPYVTIGVGALEQKRYSTASNTPDKSGTWVGVANKQMYVSAMGKVGCEFFFSKDHRWSANAAIGVQFLPKEGHKLDIGKIYADKDIYEVPLKIKNGTKWNVFGQIGITYSFWFKK